MGTGGPAPEALLLIGRIGKTHGLHGEVKVIPETDDPTRFMDLETVFVGGSPERAIAQSIESIRFQEGKHGVTVVFVELPNTKIELLHPLGDSSPIAAFLQRNPSGGIHHICYEVDDILAARDRLKAEGARVLGDGEPKIGAHDKPVLFLHPKDFCGTLIELEQA